jgi:hypothetical protein
VNESDSDGVNPNAISPMSDEEADLFRYLRFGQLEPPIRPEETVAEVGQSRPRDPTDYQIRVWPTTGH